MGKGIPPAIQALWDVLNAEVVWLHGRWLIFRQLYGTNEKRIALLNETAPTFFHIIHAVLIDDVVLTLSRLTDPSQTGGNQNAVLAQLVEHPAIQADSALGQELVTRLASLRDKCSSFRTLRNKRIAHSDLGAALKVAPQPLPGISREMVEQALAELRSFMNAVNVHFTDTPTAYEHFCMILDGDALLEALKRAYAYNKARQEGLIGWDHLPATDYWGA